MRHKIKGRKLGRNSAHRKALFSNLLISIIKNESIKTTLPKAKEIRPLVEKLVTISKDDNLSNRRLVISKLGNDSIVEKLFKELGPKFALRNGGYTRILKIGYRAGDKAPMAIIEFIGAAA